MTNNAYRENSGLVNAECSEENRICVEVKDLGVNEGIDGSGLAALEPNRMGVQVESVEVELAVASVSDNSQDAMAWSMAGFAMVPMLAGTNQPAVPISRTETECDDSFVNAHWTKYPGHELAFVPGKNLIVAAAGSPRAQVALRKIEATYGLEPNLIVATQTGVEHFFWRDRGTHVAQALETSKQHIAHIELRTGQIAVYLPPHGGKSLLLNEACSTSDLPVVGQDFIDAIQSNNSEPYALVEAAVAHKSADTTCAPELGEVGKGGDTNGQTDTSVPDGEPPQGGEAGGLPAVNFRVAGPSEGGEGGEVASSQVAPIVLMQMPTEGGKGGAGEPSLENLRLAGPTEGGKGGGQTASTDIPTAFAAFTEPSAAENTRNLSPPPVAPSLTSTPSVSKFENALGVGVTAVENTAAGAFMALQAAALATQQAVAPQITPYAYRVGSDILTPKLDKNPVVAALHERDLYKTPLGSGQHSLECPWAHEHGSGVDISATYTEPDESNATGVFECAGTHLSKHTTADLLEFLGVDRTEAKDKPTIQLHDGEMHRAVDALEQILAASGRFFQSGGLIVMVVTNPVTGDPSIVPINQQALAKALSAEVILLKYDGRS